MKFVRGFLKGLFYAFFVLVAFRNPPSVITANEGTLSFWLSNSRSVEIIKPTITPQPEPSSTPTPAPTVVVVESAVLKKSPVLKQPTPTPAPRVAAANTSSVPYSDLFDQYAQQYAVDKLLLIGLARCESGFRTGAVNGPYLGMFQFHLATWQSTRISMGESPDPTLRSNAAESIKTTAWKIAHGGLGAWPVCGKRV